MFSKNTIISEVENQRKLLEDLRGESASYTALIKDTIEDLKEVHIRISMEEARTQEIISELTKTKADLTALKNSNLDFTSKLEAIYADELEDPEEEAVG